jgi:hypothetical protein
VVDPGTLVVHSCSEMTVRATVIRTDPKRKQRKSNCVTLEPIDCVRRDESVNSESCSREGQSEGESEGESASRTRTATAFQLPKVIRLDV